MIPLPPELERVENDLKERRITGSEASNIVFRVKKNLVHLGIGNHGKLQVNKYWGRNARLVAQVKRQFFMFSTLLNFLVNNIILMRPKKGFPRWSQKKIGGQI